MRCQHCRDQTHCAAAWGPQCFERHLNCFAKHMPCGHYLLSELLRYIFFNLEGDPLCKHVFQVHSLAGSSTWLLRAYSGSCESLPQTSAHFLLCSLLWTPNVCHLLECTSGSLAQLGHFTCCPLVGTGLGFHTFLSLSGTSCVSLNDSSSEGDFLFYLIHSLEDHTGQD